MRLDTLIGRWGILGAMLVAATVLLLGLGSSGLWEPWEMDRADIARSLIAPPIIAAAIDPGHQELLRNLDAAARDAGVTLRAPSVDAQTRRANDKGSSQSAGGHRAVRFALDLARRSVVAAVVFELPLLVPDLDNARGWKRAAERVHEALEYAPNGKVVILETRDGISPEEIRSRLSTERARIRWDRTAEAFGLADLRAKNPKRLEAAISAVSGQQGGSGGLDSDRFVVLAGASRPVLADVLGDVGAHGSVVRFKQHGATRTLAPLDTWLRAASYRAMGASELSTRLPAALMCLLAAWVLMLTARTVWNVRVATFAGIIVSTTPLYFAQARSAVGEPSMLLALTLVACGLLLRERRSAARLVWSYLIAGALVGFLAKGLTALAIFTVIAGAVPLVAGDKKLQRWWPTIALGGLFALCLLWVQGQPSDSFAGQFRFTEPLFSSGPDGNAMGFDLAIKHLGFGLFPWAPLVAIAVGGLTVWSAQQRDRASLLVILWFGVPLVMIMALHRDFNQFIWPAAPAGAIAIALLFDQMFKRNVRNYFVAAAFFFMSFVVVMESLKRYPEANLSFLTFDPPFATKGPMAFPEDPRIKLILGVAGLFMAGTWMLGTAYFGRLLSFGGRAAAFFKRDTPYRVALGIALIIPPAYWLYRVGNAHRIAAKTDYVMQLGDGQRDFMKSLISLHEPAVLFAVLTGVAILLVVALRWVLPRWGSGLARAGRPAIDLLSGRRGFAAAALCFAAIAGVLVGHTAIPGDFWGDALLSGPRLVGLGASAALAGLVLYATGDRVQGLLVFVALSLFFFDLRVTRDGHWHEAGLTAAYAAGWLLLAVPTAALLLARDTQFFLGAGILMSLCLLGIVVPLLDRYSVIEHILYPGTSGYMVKRVLVKSVGTWLVYLAIIGLVVNRFYHQALRPVGRLILAFEGGRVVVPAVLVIAVMITLTMTLGFQGVLAKHFSQKHVVDTWHDAEGQGSAARLFKHGSFTTGERKDANFYTAALGELRDRQAALKVLLGSEDQVVAIQTSRGAETTRLPGWDPANDRDGDGARDAVAITGFATHITGKTLTDTGQMFPAGGLVGRVLIGGQGGQWPIVANTNQTITVGGSRPLSVSTSSRARSAYVVDAAEQANHRATAASRARRGLLIPANSLSDLNFAFRKLSGGRPLPILEGSSFRVLLATGWLNEAQGERQQNRLANATFTQAEFDRLAGVKRVSGTFDGVVEVVGYKLGKDIVPGGERVELTVYYKALKKPRKSYKIFMHFDKQPSGKRLHGDHWPLNPTRHSDDNKGCGGCYRTDHWMIGDIVADTYEIDNPRTTPAGDYMIWLGLYSPGGGDKRLKVGRIDKDTTKHDGHDRLGIGTFQIR